MELTTAEQFKLDVGEEAIKAFVRALGDNPIIKFEHDGGTYSFSREQPTAQQAFGEMTPSADCGASVHKQNERDFSEHAEALQLPDERESV